MKVFHKARADSARPLKTNKVYFREPKTLEDLKFEHKLREQLEKLASQLNATERELRLSPANILWKLGWLRQGEQLCDRQPNLGGSTCQH